jgi:hypothetical protein
MFKIWYMPIIFSCLLFSAAQMMQGFVCKTCCRRVIITLLTEVSSRRKRRKPCGCTFKRRQKNISSRLSVVRLYQHFHAFLPYCIHHPQPQAVLENMYLRTIYGDSEPSTNRVVLPARLATYSGGIDPWHRFLGFLKFKIPSLN